MSLVEAEADLSNLLKELPAIRQRYRAERDKRVREGSAQYAPTFGKFAHFAADPFVEPGFTRQPATGDVDVVIVGGGFSGLMTAARLRQVGVEDVVIVEVGGDFGGAWYWNRYPGAQCDVEAYCYLPLLEETGYVPKRRYAAQPEILEHAQRIGRQFDLYDRALFQTTVQELTWHEGKQRWLVTTDREDRLAARFAIYAMGPGGGPKLPAVPGLESFEGKVFHTSRWDYSYTGGDTTGGLVNLRDKRVGLVGTGSTGVGCAPYLAEDAEQLYLFQRTPSVVMYRENRDTDPVWAATLEPGWQRRRMDAFDDLALGRDIEDPVQDGWSELFRGLRVPGGAKVSFFAPASTAGVDTSADPGAVDADTLAELADLRMMNRIRERISTIVRDPDTAENLLPWYRVMCKRPTFSDTYLEMFNLPNVTLVDTSDTKGIQRLTSRGVVVGDVEYPIDCLVLSTGFEYGSSLDRRLPIRITGRGGREIHEHWKDGMRTFHGHSTAGFPNWFYVGRTQVGVPANYTSSIDGQTVNVAYIVSEVIARGAHSVEATAEAEQAWQDELQRLHEDDSSFLDSCTPGYFNNEGEGTQVKDRWQFDRYTPGVAAFDALTAEWRAKGDLAGLRLDCAVNSDSSEGE